MLAANGTYHQVFKLTTMAGAAKGNATLHENDFISCSAARLEGTHDPRIITDLNSSS